MPALADPGSEVVSLCHKAGYEIIPLVGPSSIFLALAASGFNGQSFAFKGYIPIKEPALSESIKSLERRLQKSGETQIFIETPYRNERLFKTLISKLENNTKLCLAVDITGENQYIKTKTVKEWKSSDNPTVKLPTIFIIGK